MKLGSYIYNCRTEKGLSVIAFAHEVGRAPHNIRNIESSKSLPRMETMSRIAKVLGVSLNTMSGLNLSDRIERYRKVYQDLFDRYKGGDTTLKFHCPVPKLVPIRTGTSGFDLHPLTGSLLTTLRESAKLAVHEVAKKTNHTPITIWHIENGNDTLSLKIIFQLAELYGCSPELIFEPFLNEKMENYIKLYNKAFYNFRKGIQIPEKKKREPKRKNGNSGSALLFIQTKEENSITRAEMARRIGCAIQSIDKIERGINFPSYRVIYNFSEVFGFSADAIFEMVLKDRITHFEENHKEIMYNYLLNKENKQTMFMTRFAQVGLKDEAPFKKISNFILTNEKRLGIIPVQVIRKIGCSAKDYRSARAGKRSLSPLMIEGLSIIFGVDKYELFNMVLEEKVEVYSKDYIRQWELYKEKINGTNGTEDSEDRKNNQLQMV